MHVTYAGRNGRLDIDELAVTLQPSQQLPIAGAGHREGLDNEHAADVIKHGSDVSVFVGVDASDDLAGLGL